MRRTHHFAFLRLEAVLGTPWGCAHPSGEQGAWTLGVLSVLGTSWKYAHPSAQEPDWSRVWLWVRGALLQQGAAPGR